MRDPYNLKLLIEASMPRGYNQRITMNYFKRIITETGIGEAPVEFYMLLPAEGRISVPNSETKTNWYRSVFRMTNTGGGDVSGVTSITASLFKQDIDGDGISEPIDRTSIMVFSDEGQP